MNHHHTRTDWFFPIEEAPVLVTVTHKGLLGKISDVYVSGQVRGTQAVNTQITATYWQIGHDIVEFEQGGSTRAEYGKRLVATLSKDLTLLHGRGFSRSNVMMMRAFYLAYPIVQTLSGQLGWSHYVELLLIDDSLERGFYEKQAIHERWSVKELQRQKKTSLFLRLAAGKDKDAFQDCKNVWAVDSIDRLIELRTRVLEEQKRKSKSPWVLNGIPTSYLRELSNTSRIAIVINLLKTSCGTCFPESSSPSVPSVFTWIMG